LGVPIQQTVDNGMPMEEKTGRERRRFLRISAVLSAESEVLIKCGLRSARATLVNFSRGGAELDIGNCDVDWIYPHSTMCLLFQRSDQAFEVLARIVRREGTHLSVRFCELTAEDERNIQLKVVLMQILAARMKPQ
jgi:c-di-GMP-binding flagellar brake protein YcgR